MIPAISVRSDGILFTSLAINCIILVVNNLQNNRTISVAETAINNGHSKVDTTSTEIAPSNKTYPDDFVSSDVSDRNENEDGGASDEGEGSKDTDKKTKKSVVKSTATTLYTAAKKKPSRRRKRDPNGMISKFKFI